MIISAHALNGILRVEDLQVVFYSPAEFGLTHCTMFSSGVYLQSARGGRGDICALLPHTAVLCISFIKYFRAHRPTTRLPKRARAVCCCVGHSPPHTHQSLQRSRSQTLQKYRFLVLRERGEYVGLQAMVYTRRFV